jgi:hypothetical protein
VDDYKWTVYTTWEMSAERLSSTAAMLLRLSAFLHHDGIPRTLFENAAATVVDKQGSFCAATRLLDNFRSESGEWSNQMFLKNIRELTSYSLINIDTERQMYSIHPLTHTWARERASITERNEAWMCMLQLLALSVPRSQAPEAFAFRSTLLPHVDAACTAGGLDRVDPSVLELFFDVNYNCRKWKAAEEVAKAALEATKKLGDDHPDTIHSMGNLASIYWYQGRWKESEVFGLQVLEMRQRVFGEEHPNTLWSMAHLALTYWNQG